MLTDQLNEIIQGLGLLGFEETLLVGALVILITGLLVRRILIIQVLFVSFTLMAMLFVSLAAEPVSLFGGALYFDGLGGTLKLLFSGSIVWIVFYPTGRQHPSEFYFLILAILLGSSLMLSANHLLIIYLAIELTSFASYAVTNFKFEKKAFEAGMKYLIFGGVSSALGLYGASLIYGFTGTLSLSEMDLLLVGENVLFGLGIVLFIGSVLFKVSVLPFHIWVPSTYQAAPTDAVAVLSVVPKIAGFVLLHRLLSTFDFAQNYWLFALLAGMGILTIGVGTLGAMSQTNVKRLIAYGAVAHSGFLLAALLIPAEGGARAFVNYAVVYAVMNMTVFYLIDISEVRGLQDFHDFAGLGKKEPLIGVLFLLVMVALIGLPPTAGFTAKFYLFTELRNSYQILGDPLLLTYLIVAVLSVMFSLFFYLKIPYNYFMKDVLVKEEVRFNPTQKVLATIFSILLLWMFFRPEILNNIAICIKFIAW